MTTLAHIERVRAAECVLELLQDEADDRWEYHYSRALDFDGWAYQDLRDGGTLAVSAGNTGHSYYHLTDGWREVEHGQVLDESEALQLLASSMEPRP